MKFIRIGHGAYGGANAMRICFSKAEAVRVLIGRGVLREVARAALKRIEVRNDGYTTMRTRNDSEVIEVLNMDGQYAPPLTPQEIKQMKAYWRTIPE